MKINIDVFLNIEGTGSRSGGTFEVNNRKYKENPDLAAAIVAYQFISDIKHRNNYLPTTIDKVIYDGDKNITELTRQIEPILPPDDLPF